MHLLLQLLEAVLVLLLVGQGDSPGDGRGLCGVSPPGAPRAPWPHAPDAARHAAPRAPGPWHGDGQAGRDVGPEGRGGPVPGQPVLGAPLPALLGLQHPRPGLRPELRGHRRPRRPRLLVVRTADRPHLPLLLLGPRPDKM
ncbi:hypothetical protein FOCC_FOCC013357 [Frankliniella occidentalis]|nr:hypothetical protein FOCC_FOCC013357 [Frankliniella occidentalis]